MIHLLRSSRLLLAAAVAVVGLAACGDDDSSDSDNDGTSNDAISEATDETTDEAGDPDDEPADDPDGDAGDTSSTAGTVTVDGVTYAFSPSVCLPDEANGSSVSGPGEGDDGAPIYVDMAAGNLSIYLGTDDPFAGDPDFVASSVAGQGSLDETVDGSTISVEANFTEHASTEVVADGSFEVSC